MKGKIKEVRKRKLVTVTLIRLVIILIITMTTIDLAVGLMLQREILNIYEDFSFSYTKMLSENIDTERVEVYLKRAKKLDSYYVEVSNEMRRDGGTPPGFVICMYLFPRMMGYDISGMLRQTMIQDLFGISGIMTVPIRRILFLRYLRQERTDLILITTGICIWQRRSLRCATARVR